MNIQNLTLEQISIAVLFIGALYGGVKYLIKEIKSFLDNLLDAKFNTINDKLDGMSKTIRDIDVQTTRSFLVRYLADIEREDFIFDSEKELFWKEYDHYKDDLKENSFIKKWAERLEEEGKLKR